MNREAIVKNQIQLPARVTLTLPAQAVAVIMQSLGEFGPHKLVHPVLSLLEQQLLAQQIVTPPEPLEQVPEPVVASDADQIISADQ